MNFGRSGPKITHPGSLDPTERPIQPRIHRLLLIPVALLASDISGRVTVNVPGSISVKDGDRTVTCATGSGSPSVAGFELGDHLKIGCVNGVLVSVVELPPYGTTAPRATTSAATTTTTTTHT